MLPGEVDTAPIIPVPVDQPVDSNIVPPGNPDSPIGNLPPAGRPRGRPVSRRGRGRGGRGRPHSASGQRAAVRQREPHVPRQVPAAARRPRRGRRVVDSFERASVPVRGVRRQRELSPTEILSYKRSTERGWGSYYQVYERVAVNTPTWSATTFCSTGSLPACPYRSCGLQGSHLASREAPWCPQYETNG